MIALTLCLWSQFSSNETAYKLYFVSFYKAQFVEDVNILLREVCLCFAGTCTRRLAVVHCIHSSTIDFLNRPAPPRPAHFLVCFRVVRRVRWPDCFSHQDAEDLRMGGVRRGYGNKTTSTRSLSELKM